MAVGQPDLGRRGQRGHEADQLAGPPAEHDGRTAAVLPPPHADPADDLLLLRVLVGLDDQPLKVLLATRAEPDTRQMRSHVITVWS